MKMVHESFRFGEKLEIKLENEVRIIAVHKIYILSLYIENSSRDVISNFLLN